MKPISVFTKSELKKLNEFRKLTPEEQRAKYVFNDKEDYNVYCFLRIIGRSQQNGVSDRFLEFYYNNDLEAWFLDNISNKRCYNCRECEDCLACGNSSNCTNCKYSINSYSRENKQYDGCELGLVYFWNKKSFYGRSL